MKDKPHPFSQVFTSCFKKKWVFKLLSARKNNSIIDIGCGAGYLVYELERMGVCSYGVDISLKALKTAHQYVSRPFCCCEVSKLPFIDLFFDGAVSTDSLEHIENDLESLKEIKRILKRNAPFVVYVPSQSGILKNTRYASLGHDEECSYLKDVRNGYTRQGLIKLLTDAGYINISVRYHLFFIQEAVTQLSKLLLKKSNIRYSDQGDISSVVESNTYKVLNSFFFPLIHLLVNLEDFFTMTIFKGCIPGHRLIAVGYKP